MEETKVTEVRMHPGARSLFRVYLTVHGECKVESFIREVHGRYLDEGTLTKDEVLQLALSLTDLASGMKDLDGVRADAAASERERAANVCEQMVVGGRAWDRDQQIAAGALFQAARNIRALK